MVQVTYQKRNGNIIQRLRTTLPPYKIGEMTSMGWKVLNFEYQYEDKFYNQYDYNKIIYKEKMKCIKRHQARELYIKELKNLLYCIVAVLVMYFIKKLIGM